MEASRTGVIETCFHRRGRGEEGRVAKERGGEGKVGRRVVLSLAMDN